MSGSTRPSGFARVSTPQDMLDLGEAGLVAHIKSIGLYKTKAKHCIEAARILIQNHAGEVPRDRAALEALPGVGRKTANVVLNMAFGMPTFAVDTHVFRVSNRSGLAPGKTVLAVERALDERVPEPYRVHAHHWLILHGRYTCKARKPDCTRCVVQDICLYPEKSVTLQQRWSRDGLIRRSRICQGCSDFVYTLFSL